MGWITRKIEATAMEIAERKIREAFEPGGQLYKVVRDACGLDLPDNAPLNRGQFILAMARRLCAAGTPQADALPMARSTLRELLTDERITFGDRAYDWSRNGANDLVEEYELRHWESA